jgi:hypothetical protein
MIEVAGTRLATTRQRRTARFNLTESAPERF